jgi:hypothetical protein
MLRANSVLPNPGESGHCDLTLPAFLDRSKQRIANIETFDEAKELRNQAEVMRQ